MATATKKLFGIFNLFRRRGSLPSPAPAVNRVGTDSTLSFTERRQSPRRWGDPVQVLIWDEIVPAQPTKGWVANRSAGGLGLSAPQPALEGAVLSVRIAAAPDTIPRTRVQVKSCTAVTGHWVF